MKNQVKICRICKACICILQLYILTYSIRRRHKPKRHAKRKTRLLVWLPSLMRWKISAMWLSYIYIYRQVIFFHAVQILNIKKLYFKQDAFRLFPLKTFSTVHRLIISAIICICIYIVFAKAMIIHYYSNNCTVWLIQEFLNSAGFWESVLFCGR